jgi:uncharacterized protein YacL
MSGALLIKGVKLIAALGVSKVISDVVRVNAINTNIASKVMSNIGGLVLGSMIMDHASKHVDETINAITEKIEEEKQKKDNEPEIGSTKEGP